MRIRFVAWVTLVVGCSSAANVPSLNPSGNSEQEQAVWSSVLTTFITDSTRQLVVRDSAFALAANFIDGRELLRRFPEASETLVNSFIEDNDLGERLPPFNNAAVPISYVGQADLAPFRSAGSPDDYWDAFYAAHPDSPGLIRLSRVGFDESSGYALVFVTHMCGGRCGSGAYTLLSSRNDTWEVIDRWVVSVS